MYCNTGDWVENCTALIEDDAGELKLWNWAAAGAEQQLPIPIGGFERAA